MQMTTSTDFMILERPKEMVKATRSSKEKCKFLHLKEGPGNLQIPDELEHEGNQPWGVSKLPVRGDGPCWHTLSLREDWITGYTFDS